MNFTPPKEYPLLQIIGITQKIILNSMRILQYTQNGKSNKIMVACINYKAS